MAAPTPVTIYEDRDPRTAQRAGRGYLGRKRVLSATLEIWMVQSTATGRFVLSSATSAPAGALYPVESTSTGRFVVATSEAGHQLTNLNVGRFVINDGSRAIGIDHRIWGIRNRASEADGRFVQTTATAVTIVGVATGAATSGKIALINNRRIMVTVLPNATATA